MSAGLPPRPVRRVVLDPLFLPVGLSLAAVFAAVGALAWLLAQVLRRPRGRVWRLAALAAGYLLLDVGMVLGSFWLWLRSPRGARISPDEWRDAHTRLLRWTLDQLVALSRWTLQFTVELPASLPIEAGHEPPILVLARHAGPGDSFALVHLIAADLGRCPRVVLKAALQWDPGLDVLLNRLSCCFLASRSGAGEDQSVRLAELAATLTAKDALLLFPEGGNWTPKRHGRAIGRLWRSGRRRAARLAAAHPRVLPPRPGGTLACLAARPDADVIVVAHTGLDTLVSPALIWRALPLQGRPMRIGWWRIPAAELPAGEDGQLAWLEEQWHRVDGWVAARSDR